MRRLFLMLALWLTMGPVLAQPAPLSPALHGELVQLQQAALSSDYAWQQCFQLCNVIGPRLSGSPQAARAVQYVAEEMRRQGFTVHLEPVTVPHWVRGVETGEVVGWPGQAAGASQKLVLTALGNSVPTPPTGLTAEVVVVDSFDALDRLPDARVKGRAVLFNKRFDKGLAALNWSYEAYEQAVVYRSRGPVAAARKGAVLCLVRSVGGADYRLPHTGGFRYDDKVPKIPAAAVAVEDAELLASLAGRGEVRVHVTLTPHDFGPTQSYNVIADLPGATHPDEFVVVSGHLDSWDLGTGALDDAAGVSMAMAVGHLVTAARLHPARTLRVIAYMNEENGLAGGRAYVAAHNAELSHCYAAIESDFGAGRPAGFFAHLDARAAQRLEPLRAILESSGSPTMQIIPDAAGADIWPLDEAGVPTFAPMSDGRTYFDYHHTPADTLDKIDPRALAQNVAVDTVLAYALCNLEGPLSPRQ